MFNGNCWAKKLIMIPKYLLKEVLFYKEKYKYQTEITRLVPNKNYIEYTSEVTGNPYNYITHDKINIYELAHRCKEWARDNEFFLRSFYDYEGAFCYISAPVWVDKIEIPKTGFCSDTEPEAIFKACEWILKQVEKK